MTEVCVTEDKTTVVVVALYRSVSRNRARFKTMNIVHSPCGLLYHCTDLFLFAWNHIENLSRALKLSISRRISAFISKKSKNRYRN